MIGVIPQALVDAEVAHRGLTELHVVQGMHQRKQLFTDLSDGFVTIPGGTGTMDELWEALSWAQLGYHADPVGLLNSAGYYDHLIAFWDKMGEVGFLRPQHRDLLIVADTLDVLLETGWIKLRGRRRAPGRPVTYGTTEQFLGHFGFDSIQDLPGLSELKGAGLLDSNLPPGFAMPNPDNAAALREDEDPLEDEPPMEDEEGEPSE